jgi:hypothetical protein
MFLNVQNKLPPFCSNLHSGVVPPMGAPGTLCNMYDNVKVVLLFYLYWNNCLKLMKICSVSLARKKNIQQIIQRL